ncbi:MAG: malonic semialdehyde reductase [Pseudomonadota bacterium]
MPNPQMTVVDAFEKGRSFSHWQAKPVSETLLHDLYEMLKWGPTSANCCPLRILFVQSEAEKAKLVECVSDGNKEKVESAPVTAILAFDPEFYEKLPFLYPHTDAKSWFAGEENEEAAQETAFRNSSLQAAYFMIAARAVGLDCGPMSGFDKEALEAAFLKEKGFKVNMICSLGYGRTEELHPRSPRLSFDEAAEII